MFSPHSQTASHDEKNLGNTKEDEELQASMAIESPVWRKIDLWILPLCTILFLLSIVDETNISNARLAGLQQSLGMSNYQYTLALTLTYVSYMAIEFPSALFLKHVGPNVMLPAMAMLWGIVSAIQGLVDSYPGLFACRFFIGLCEGGIFPGIVLYLSFFYPRKMLQIRVTVFWALASLAGMFSGLLAAAINKLDGMGGKPGWAWIFILEGAFSLIFGLICFFLLPRVPENSHFLTGDEQKYVISALRHAGSISEDDTQDRFSWTEIITAMKSPHLWLLSVVLFFSGAVVLGLIAFEPTIVAGLGYSGDQAQLMSVPPYATATILAFISAVISDRYQCRGYIVIFFSLFQVIGFTMFYVSTSRYVRYASLFVSVPGTFCVAPALNTWIANNSAPHARRATVIAISFMVSELGGILATWLLGWLSPAPDYTAATVTFIAMSVGMVAFSTANLVYLRQENLKKADKRQRMRKEDEPEGLGDRSAWFIYSL